MSETKVEHSPLPWSIADDGSLGSIICANGDAVAQAQQRIGDRDSHHAERRANTALITHRVNHFDALVEALRGVTAAIVAAQDDPNALFGSETKKAIRTADAAIRVTTQPIESEGKG